MPLVKKIKIYIHIYIIIFSRLLSVPGQCRLGLCGLRARVVQSEEEEGEGGQDGLQRQEAGGRRLQLQEAGQEAQEAPPAAAKEIPQHVSRTQCYSLYYRRLFLGDLLACSQYYVWSRPACRLIDPECEI